MRRVDQLTPREAREVPHCGLGLFQIRLHVRAENFASVRRGADAESLFWAADVAMYSVKRSGKSRIALAGVSRAESR